MLVYKLCHQVLRLMFVGSGFTPNLLPCLFPACAPRAGAALEGAVSLGDLGWGCHQQHSAMAQVPSTWVLSGQWGNSPGS